jgi:O-antigen/teichoic acid export membrane protein
MALRKNLALMGFSTIARLFAGLISFSVLARLLGLESFGVLMLWLSVATLLALFTNYGLTTYVLRKIGSNPEVTEALMSEGFTAKLMLTALLLVCVVAASTAMKTLDWAMLLILLLGCSADTFTEFINAGFRARDRFATETTVSVIFSVLHAALLAGAVYWNPTVIVAAAAYTTSRAMVLAVTVGLMNRHIAPLRIAPLRASLALLRDAVNYAGDFGMQSLFGQIDSLVVNHFLGAAAVGLYQAGMRIFLGGFQAASILANVFLPQAAAAAESTSILNRVSNQLQFAFIGVGLILGLAQAIAAKPIVAIMFGPTFSDLILLLPYFGLLFFLRFAAAAWGVLLTATGQQGFRTKAGAMQWAVIAASAAMLVPKFGIRGWLIALCIGTSMLGMSYAHRARNRVANLGVVLGVTIAGVVCFVPFL